MTVIKITTTTPVTLEDLEVALQREFRKALSNLADAAFHFWGDVAARHLRRSLHDYQDALQHPRKVDEDTYEIMLHHSNKRANWLIMAIECGYPAFDIKPKLLESPSALRWSQYAKAHEPGSAKPKRFLDVPFRTKGGVRTQDKPNQFRRLTEKSAGWEHPGFKPLGGQAPSSRDLGTPYRQKVIEYIEKQAPRVLGPLISKITI